MKSVMVDKKIIKQMKIVDIRLKMEWKQTGIVENSLPISFYNAFGLPKPKKFVEELDKQIDKDEEFGIICRTGSRTSQVAEYLSGLGYNVVNLDGGVMELANQGYEFIKYKD